MLEAASSRRGAHPDPWSDLDGSLSNDVAARDVDVGSALPTRACSPGGFSRSLPLSLDGLLKPGQASDPMAKQHPQVGAHPPNLALLPLGGGESSELTNRIGVAEG